MAAADVVAEERLIVDQVSKALQAAVPGPVPVPADAADSPLGVPAAAPPGTGGFAFLHEAGGGPVAFDPCRPVHYVVRLSGAPAGSDALLHRALGQLGAATGLVFVPDGATDEAPSDGRPAVQPDRHGDRWAPVLIAWSDARESPELTGDVAGYAGPVLADPDGRGLRYVSGIVVLDREAFGAQPDREHLHGLLLHELGHLVGLAHADDPADVMHARSRLAPAYTPGALRGLAALGTGRCFS